MGDFFMKQVLHKVGKFYSNIMINMIGIFIFTGVLSVLFGECGWFPDSRIYAISVFVYSYVVPILIAYTAGNQIGKIHEADDPHMRTSGTHHAGGAIAVLAASAMILADKNSAILGAMILGPLCGFLWKNLIEPWTRKVMPGMEMLVRNLAAALAGMLMAFVAYFAITPAVQAVINVLMPCVNWLIAHRLVCLASIVIEPAKVFFLNNCINHGILLPLAMQQVEKAGASVLFLLESNPGPGLGVLFACWLCRKSKRKKYAAYLFVECIGGIHEIYFPEVLSNLWLMFPLIAGGVTGSFFFSVLQAGAAGVVSPGSIVTVLLMTSQHAGAALISVAASAAAAAGTAVIILKIQENRNREKSAIQLLEAEEENKNKEPGRQDVEKNPVVQLHSVDKEETKQQDSGILKFSGEKEHMEQQEIKIGFVCDAGVGSSAMGAGLLRRKLKEQGMDGIQVEAYASDQVPQDLTIAVCQKNFKEMLQQTIPAEHIVVMESLLDQEAHMRLIEYLKKECGNV